MVSSLNRLRFLAALIVAGSTLPAADPVAPSPSGTGSPEATTSAHPLVWDAMEKTLDVKPGDEAATFSFSVTNTSTREIEIHQVHPSCGCTVAELPSTPWILPPNGKGSFRATVDFRGKHGKFAKTLHVASSAGPQVLSVVVNIPESDEATRIRNQELAKLDRQAVFRGECAACHTTPLIGKTGPELFQVACGICHFAATPASMVPNLVIPREPRDAAYWRKWITEGKEQSLMPAFAEERGGPLNAAQIDSLVEFLMANFPRDPIKP
jgi:mono/diheme cytochrome c family protein